VATPLKTTRTKTANAPERPLHDYLAAVSDRSHVRAGSALPLGTSQQENGGNLAFFSHHATRVRLEFFDHAEDSTPSRRIDPDRVCNRTGDGQQFNFATLLLDPYATAISSLDNWDSGKNPGCDPSAPDRDLVHQFHGGHPFEPAVDSSGPWGPAPRSSAILPAQRQVA